MGINYQAILFVGAGVDELCKHLNVTADDIQDMDFEIVQPYYDAPMSESFAGIPIAQSPRYFAYKLDEHETQSISTHISDAVAEFESRFKFKASLFISPQSY
jgi:hypothetical protein